MVTDADFPRNLWPRCTCPWGVRGLGRLYGVNMGKGLVRLSTAPGCPEHDDRKAPRGER